MRKQEQVYCTAGGHLIAPEDWRSQYNMCKTCYDEVYGADETAEETTMRYKVKTTVNLTPEQLSTLQHLGCKPTPYITWSHAWVFAAYCEHGQKQELRNLEYVTSVEPMPTYQVA